MTELQAKVTELAEKFGVPGVSVGVVNDGVEEYGYAGVTNVDHPLPVDETTLFQFGSTGKTFTATAVMRLVEQGKVDLDAPVRTYVPELRLRDEGVARDVTVLQLFNHTAGWEGDLIEEMGNGDDVFEKYVTRMADLQQVTPLGAAVSYNNASLSLAGRLIEKVTGMTYEAAMADLLFEPLGLSNTFFFANDVMTRRFAVGHRRAPDGTITVARPWAMPRGSAPAGGMSATARDQIAWARFHLGDGTADDGTTVLTKESVRRMQEPTAHMPGSAIGDAVGISWLLSEVGGARKVGHGGTTNGQHSDFVLIPDRQFGVISMANCGPNGPEFNHAIVRWALSHYLGLDQAPAAGVRMPDEALMAYAGRYETIAAIVEVTVDEGRLRAQAQIKPEMAGALREAGEEVPTQPPVHLAMLTGDGDKFVIDEGDGMGMTGYFWRGPGGDGDVEGIHFGGRLATRTATPAPVSRWIPLGTRLRLATVAVAFLVAACGSTVPVEDRVQTAAQGNDGLELPGTTAAPGSELDGAAATTATSPGQLSAGGSTSPATSDGGRASVPSAVAPSNSGPGVTAKEVYVGIIYDVNAGAVNQAFGAGAITSGDSKANTEAVVKDINSRGGVGGRTLVPVYGEFDSTSTQTFDQQYAALCQKFTKDNPRVFAVQGEGVESYRECISKAGVTMVSTSLPSLGQAEFARYHGLIEQGYPNVDRLAAYHVTPLVEQDYFTPWNTTTGQPAPAGVAKVGILTYDDQVFSNAVDRYLIPALKKLGYTPEVARIAQINTAGDYGAQGAAVQSAQLSFAARGVTHVIPFEANGGLSTLFLPVARSQGYYPRYGVSSASGFQALIETGLPDSRQMAGAVGYGWLPSLDLPRAMNPPDAPYSNANRRACLKVMADAGIVFDSGNAEGIALNTCANLYLLKTALDRVSGAVNLNTLISTIEGLGSSYERAGSVGQEFRPGRHDPSNAAYHWRYFADCNCFHYEGSRRPVP